MNCPSCKKQKVVVLRQVARKGFYYLECPTPDCWCVRVQEVKK